MPALVESGSFQSGDAGKVLLNADEDKIAPVPPSFELPSFIISFHLGLSFNLVSIFFFFK
jgi:hypothetical protein